MLLVYVKTIACELVASRSSAVHPLQKVTFYGSTLVDNGTAVSGQPLEIPGASQPGLVSKGGLVLFGNDGKTVWYW